ncbi:MAG: carotenoid biosynthesis protein [Acidobacteriaceae bacterium]
MAGESVGEGGHYNLFMREGNGARNALVALLAVYAGARGLQIFPTRVPTLLIVILHVAPPAIFAFIHGRRVYGLRGIVVFMVLCLGVSTFFESLGLWMGFPFGHYFFTGVMGPKVFSLPVLLALAYVGVGYVAWVVGSLMVGAGMGSRAGWLVTPWVAAAVMTAWDLAMDPVWAHIDHAWVWEQGGGYFGVPFSNYFGWLLTTWVFYQAFALWVRGREVGTTTRAWSRLAVGMYGLVAAGNLLLVVPSAIPAGFPATITDAAGRRWLTSDVVGNCVVISIFVMGPFAVIAWARAGGLGIGTKQASAEREHSERVMAG